MGAGQRQAHADDVSQTTHTLMPRRLQRDSDKGNPKARMGSIKRSVCSLDTRTMQPAAGQVTLVTVGVRSRGGALAGNASPVAWIVSYHNGHHSFSLLILAFYVRSPKSNQIRLPTNPVSRAFPARTREQYRGKSLVAATGRGCWYTEGAAQWASGADPWRRRGHVLSPPFLSGLCRGHSFPPTGWGRGARGRRGGGGSAPRLRGPKGCITSYPRVGTPRTGGVGAGGGGGEVGIEDGGGHRTWRRN